MEPKRCDNCDKQFTPKNIRGRFCSPRCRYQQWAGKNNDKVNRYSRDRYQVAIYGSPTKIEDMTKDKYRRARVLGYRSGLEVRNAQRLDALGADYEYEPFKIPFVQPEKPRTYTPDYVLPNGIVIDTKGRWVTEDRQKFKWLVEQHPDLDLRMVFSNPNQRIGKNSPTTYAIYATRLGIPFAKEFIPQEWIDEPLNQASLDAIARLT